MVTREEAAAFAARHNILYFESSAATDTNVYPVSLSLLCACSLAALSVSYRALPLMPKHFIISLSFLSRLICLYSVYWSQQSLIMKGIFRFVQRNPDPCPRRHHGAVQYGTHGIAGGRLVVS